MGLWRSWSLSKPALLTNFADKFDNSLVHFRHVDWFHRIQIHTRNDFTIVIEYVHMSRWVIANPPDKMQQPRRIRPIPQHSSGQDLRVDVKAVGDGEGAGAH